ncbi:MAG: hypothetical protein AB7D37_20570 [Desulfovibrio sp.]
MEVDDGAGRDVLCFVAAIGPAARGALRLDAGHDCGNNRASGEAPHFKNKRFFLNGAP